MTRASWVVGMVWMAGLTFTLMVLVGKVYGNAWELAYIPLAILGGAWAGSMPWRSR